MSQKSSKISDYLLKHIPMHPQTIVNHAASHFQVSRTTIHRHLNRLLKENKIIKTGTTRQVQYYLSNELNKTYHFKLNASLTEESVWKEHFARFFKELPRNIYEILNYGFTEIFNNAIDHSQAKQVAVSINWENDNLSLIIKDNGIGIYQKINSIFHFTDLKESLLHLTKGKLTTDPINHTGEGLFFTSRAFDEFYLTANKICFYRNNLVHDWAVEKSDEKNGTEVILKINIHSKRKLNDLFNLYTGDDDFSFNKTELLVDLGKLEGDMLISRSQAKRLLARLESFNHFTLDFQKVSSVGQGFVDEIFRVYLLKNPNVTIKYIHANNEVEFMIKRGLGKS